MASANINFDDLNKEVDMNLQDTNIDVKKVLDEFKKCTSPLVTKRAVLKRKITNILKKLAVDKESNVLTQKFYKVQEAEVQKLLTSIEEFDDQILEVSLKLNLNEVSSVSYEQIIDTQTNYSFLVLQQITDLMADESPKVSGNVDASNLNNSMVSGDALQSLIANMQHSNLEIRPPPLACPNFDGRSVDRLEFKTFLTQFQNVIGCKNNLSDASKLVYLRGYLKGYAHQLIQHLSVNDENYEIALSLLKAEFLDLPYIIDETLKQILNAKAPYDPQYQSARAFLNEMRALLYELKSLKLDFFTADSPGSVLVSHIVFNKLPFAIKRELTHRTRSNYPTITEIFESYNEVIKTLNKTVFVKSDTGMYTGTSTEKSQNKIVENKNNNKKPYFKSKFNEATLQNFKTNAEQKTVPQQPASANLYNNNAKFNQKPCKLCSTAGHSLVRCPKYSNVQARIARLNVLKLCVKCSSTKHVANDCPGNRNELSFPCQICSSKAHIAAVCVSGQQVQSEPSTTSTNLCLNHNHEQNKPYLLPTYTITVGRANNAVQVQCLIDSGSQRSYFSDSVFNAICSDSNLLTPTEFEIKTFIGSERRELCETMLEISLSSNKINMPVLIDKKMNLKFEVSDIDVALKNIVQNGFNLADSSLSVNCDNSVIKLGGLLGIDILQFLPTFEKVNCMRGSAFLVTDGIIPYGNVDHFLYYDQVSQYAPPVNDCTNNNKILQSDINICLHIEEVNSSIVNFVVQPTKTFFDPLDNIYDNSQVEHGLDYLFSLESIGIKEFSQLNTVDEIKLKEFYDGILFEDNRYYVNLPWFKEKLEQVPSNSKIALAVLNRVATDLKQKGLFETYDKVFKQYLEDGIIEEVDISDGNFANNIWIPHRPIVKTDSQTTTKVRPVFNASLRADGFPSLNDSAYSGIDLMASIPKLLLHFRSNLYVQISDIKQAFLQVHIKTDEDKNRFSFFWLDGEELKAYRYNTIIFGFTSSPFVLHYVVKYHASKYPKDFCSKILSNNMYVDNLIVTSNDLDVLRDVYVKANSRMSEGGFTLRSWNSNNVLLQNMMKEDNKFVEHGTDIEKILGYQYSISNDEINLADFDLDSNVKSKRGILSGISKVFDPLGLYSPVTVRGRLLMRTLWQSDIGWDEEAPKEILGIWKSLSVDLINLKEISMPRCAFVPSEFNSIHVFCDASKQAYAFAAYAFNGQTSNLIFAKSKVAPMKERTLPSLELLSVFLTFKCLDTLLSAFDPQTFKFVNVLVDAQCVLSWLLSEDSKSKNVFTKNRIKDIITKRKEIEAEFSIKIYFSYVNTLENPADMLTRGLSIENYKTKMIMWLHGPDWVSNELSDAPSNPLLCIPEDLRNQNQTMSNVAVLNSESDSESVIPMEKFSNFHKLVRVTSLVFKFISKLRKKKVDCDFSAKLYLLRVMQSECFQKELNYLEFKPKDEPIPALINQLNLFLDDNGILRSRGRIGKTLFYDYDVINPILLGKTHKLTELIIWSFHLKCQHLGLSTTVNCLRTGGYWVPRARQVVKKVISQCVTCTKMNALAFKYPRMTNMSKDKMNFIKPYENVGVDYTGHFYVKDLELGKCVKYYILIYTCLHIRSIHLDLIPDMSTGQFLLSYQRFSNLYGIPSALYSDNAKSFTQAGKILGESLNSDEFSEHLRLNGTSHIQIPLYSAWVGSAWERLIRVVKSCLYKTVGRSKLTYFEFLTSLSNIQNAVNSRPLTYRSSECGLDVITPNSFLKLHCNKNLILKDSLKDDCLWDGEAPSRKCLDETLTVQMEVFENFKTLWYESYLLSLRELGRNLYQSDWVNRIRVDDIVLVKVPNRARPFWLLGHVLEIILGHDNKIRSVKLKRGDGVIAHHSIVHLYPLELSLTHHCSSSQDSDQPEDAQENTGTLIQDIASNSDNDQASENSISNDYSNSNTGARPKRKAAVKCREFIQTIAPQL